MRTNSPLTCQQIEELRDHPCVQSLRPKQVSFTAAFKEHAYKEYLSGKSIPEILYEAGIDPELLGKNRINSLRTHVMAQGKKGEGFRDAATRCRRTGEARPAARSTEEKIARLEHELAYTKQELEYLKKIYLADREAQRACDMKLRRKSNSESSEK